MTLQQRPAIGSWRVELRPDDQPNPSGALIALLPGGILINAPAPVEPFPLVEEGSIYVSTCLGAWSEAGDRDVDFGFVAQATNSKGVTMGFGSVRATGSVDDDDALSGRYHFEMATPDGVVVATEDGQLRGVRITATAPERSRFVPAMTGGHD